MEVRLPVPGGLAWRLSALGLVVAVATAISYLVFAFAPQERARAIDRWRAQLSAMASDRQSAIDSWLGEKLADARTVAGYPTVLRLVGTADTLPASSRGGQELRTHLGDVLRSLVRNGGYRGAALLDAQGRLLMSVGPEPELRADCLALPRRALAARRSLAELHLHAGARPLIQLAAPIGSEARAAPVGVVLLSVDPEDWLYPFLRSQPLASESEETLLAGREGASIVLLSPLRYRPDPPMTLRLPLTTPRLVAAAAFQGGGKFGDYADYRGEAVLAVTRELATMPWQLVAKVDRSEALAGVRENVMQATLALFGVCVALASSFLCTWRALRARAQARLARAEARLSFLLDQASDVILVVDADGRIRDANERTVELYGYPREALRGLHVSELLRDKDRELVEQRKAQLLEQERLTWESMHVTSSGRELPVEVAARNVELDGERLTVAIVRDISERKRADESLRASETRFRSLFESMLNGFAHCRMLFEGDEPVDFVYLDVNDAFTKLTGLEGVIGRRVSEVIPGLRETNPELLQIYGRVATTGTPAHFESYVSPLGTWFSVSAYRTQAGHFVAVFDNINERKRAEEAVRQKDRLLQLTGEMAKVGGWEFDARTLRGTWTDEVARIHDLEPGLETNVELGLSFYSGESRRRIDAALKAAIEAGEPYDLELEMTSARGVRKWVRTMGLPIVGDGGVVRVQGIFQDVTARKQADDEIRRLNSDLERRVAERTSELACLNQELQGEVEGRARMQLAVERYAREVEDLYNHAPCGYHSLDADGRFVTVNDTELEWLGYTRDELLGRSVQDVLFPSARETFAAHYPEFKLRGTLRDLELEMRRKDGSRFWALLNATAVRDEEGGYLRSRSTMFDITDLVQARQEVARRTAALEAANRELESFSYSVSHDLRAPLRAIAGFSSLLASDYSGQLDAEAKGLLDRVCDNTRRMSQLIDDLLAFSGVGRKQMHQGRLSMNGLVAACVAELTAGLDPSRLEIEVGALPDAFGDAAMLRQVWTNLLSNALKFTSQRPRARVLVRGGSVNGERVYSVEDNGVGFDKRYAGKLFGVFQRLHNQREFPGTGVGLALVQRVVERHGGRIWADSRPGEGATFSFALPAPPPESSASD